MDLKFEPSSGTNFATLNFAGTGCALRPFTNIPVAENVTAVANREPDGIGATAWLLKSEESKAAMQALDRRRRRRRHRRRPDNQGETVMRPS
jgi:hypothetical protein